MATILPSFLTRHYAPELPVTPQIQVQQPIPQVQQDWFEVDWSKLWTLLLILKLEILKNKVAGKVRFTKQTRHYFSRNWLVRLVNYIC